MAVKVSRPHGAFRRAREIDEGAKQTLTARCAWCRRYRVGGRWFDAGRRPPIPPDRTTHGICDECAERLREAGLSA
jgi:hypothetical protein